MPTKAERLNELMQLAQDRFNNLSDPERKLLQKLANGKEANYSSYDERPPLRASLIAWLCTDTDVPKFMTRQGLNIINATIKCSLDLSFSNIEFPLIFDSCYFMQGIKLSQAKLRFLDLSGSQVLSDTGPSLDLSNAEIEGRVLLGLGFKACGEVVLYNAKLGSLECDGGSFENPDNVAIQAEGVKIRGSAFFRKKEIELTGAIYEFESVGEVTLSGAVIGGGVYCENGTFNNLGGTALNAQNVQIGEDIFLCGSFHAFGEVFLSGAKVGGDLDCNNGRFYNPKGNSLTAEGIEIKGSASFLKSVFNASKTALSLTGARIGLNLQCEDGKFDSFEGSALICDSSVIGAFAFLCNGFEANGKVSLYGTTIGRDLKCSQSVFNNPGKTAFLAQSLEVRGSLFLTGSKVKGTVWIANASIGGSFECLGSTFDSPKEDALVVQNANIKGSILLRKASKISQAFKATGRVSLNGTSIGGKLECCGAIFNNEGKDAILLQGAKVERSITLYDVEILGNVVLLNAVVNGSFTWMAVQNPCKLALDLRSVKIQTLIDEPNSWPQKDKLLLAGLVYERIHENSPLDYKLRLEWLRLQPENKYSFQPYGQLDKVLRESGREDSAKEILIAKQRDLRKYRVLNEELDRFSFNWFADYFLEYTIAYGHKPFQVVRWMTCFIAIGAFLFWIGYSGNPKLISPTKIGLSNKGFPESGEISEYYPRFNSIVYSLDTFVPIVNLRQHEYWLPNATRRRFIKICSPARGEFIKIPIPLGSLLRWYMWFHIIIGWILTSLFVAGLTGLVRRIN